MAQKYTKYVTFSYDDGVTQDKRLVKIFHKYGLKATFNINSELLGKPGYLRRENMWISHNKIEPEEAAELYKEHEGIFIEIEKVGQGNSDEENKIRQKREGFYEKLGFCELGFDLELYKIIYSTFILPCTKNEISDEKAIKYFFEIYNETLGKRRVKKNYKILKR